jgi:type II secretory pathway pseudopilin PulG
MRKRSKSFGLVEVLLSAMIFVILIGGISILVQRAIASSVEATNRQIALNYAQEGIEAVRQVGVVDLSTFMDASLKMGYPVQTDTLGAVSAHWRLVNVVGTDFNNNPPWNIVDASWKPYGSDNPTFSRLVMVEKTTDANGDYYQIQCRVAWDTLLPSGPKNYVELSTILTN